MRASELRTAYPHVHTYPQSPKSHGLARRRDDMVKKHRVIRPRIRADEKFCAHSRAAASMASTKRALDAGKRDLDTEIATLVRCAACSTLDSSALQRGHP
jgi:hypothetical protein